MYLFLQIEPLKSLFLKVTLFFTTIVGFEQVVIKISHFADFEQVKKTNCKTPVGETGYLGIFFEATSLYHQHSILASQTYEGLHQLWLYPDTGIFFVFWTPRHPVF